MRGSISVDHFDGDSPARGDLMAALACPFADGGAFGAIDRCAGRPNTAASARSSCSPTSGHPRLQLAAQFLGVLLRQVDLVADTVQRELHRFVGGLAVEIIEQGDSDLFDHLHHRPSYGWNPKCTATNLGRCRKTPALPTPAGEDQSADRGGLPC